MITLLVRNYLGFFGIPHTWLGVWASSSSIWQRQKPWGWGYQQKYFPLNVFSPQENLRSANVFKTRQVYRCAGVKLVVKTSATPDRSLTALCPLREEEAFRKLHDARPETCKFCFPFKPGAVWRMKEGSSFQGSCCLQWQAAQPHTVPQR